MKKENFPNLLPWFVLSGLFFLFLSSMFGCAVNAQKSIEPKIEESKLKPLAAEVVPGSSLFKYSVRLMWEKNGDSQSWSLRKKDVTTNTEQNIQVADPNAQQLLDDTVESGHRYQYVLFKQRENEKIAQAAIEIQVPKDMEITTAISLAGTHHLGRILFRSKGRVVTEGRDLNLIVRELTSENSRIETFSLAKSAPNGAPGRNGGAIVVQVERGVGTLHIDAHGEDGGDGITGAIGGDGSRGRPGSGGLATHETVDVVCGCAERARAIRGRLESVLVNDRVLAFAEWSREKFRHRCIQEPSDGEMGGKGGPGFSGGDGANGGNSPRVFVQVAESDSFSINIVPRPGQGGTSGQGGPGGWGGFGGNPGDHALDHFHVCRGARQGLMGPAGDNGYPGRGGLAGQENAVCVVKAKSRFGNCESFGDFIKN